MYLEPLPAIAHASGATVLDWSSVSRQPSQPLLPTSLGWHELRLAQYGRLGMHNTFCSLRLAGCNATLGVGGRSLAVQQATASCAS